MGAGRPQKADPGTLYAFAHQFYWDFRRLSEGKPRLVFDQKRYEQLIAERQQNLQLTPEQKGRAAEVAEEEVRFGRIPESEREARRRDVEDAQLTATREWLSRETSEECTRESKFKGEPDVIEALLDPRTTPRRIRALCEEAFMHRIVKVRSEIQEVEVPAWPIAVGTVLPHYLTDYAEQYVAALRDPRFPRCAVTDRPSNRLKQLWFVSRALAGALFGVTTRTAINLVGSLRPEQVFQESRYAKPTRKQSKPKKYKTN